MITRRKFLRTGAAASAAWMAGAPYLRAQSRPPVVGSGGMTFECLHDWARVPSGTLLGDTHGVVVDGQGLVHVYQTVGKGSQSADALLVFDETGKFVRSWGAEFQGTAHGLHLNRESGEDFFYLSNHKTGTVVKTTPAGEVLWRAGFPEVSGLYQKSAEYKPTNVATSPDGRLYVADGYGKSFIHIYTQDGRYQKSFGGLGSEPGKFRCPHGLMVDVRSGVPVLLIADRGNRRVQKFDLEGKLLGLVETETRLPCHFRECNGTLVIPDLQSRVTLLDRQNRVLVHLGGGADNRKLRGQPRSSYPAGGFIAPHDAAFDPEGNLFVVEWVPDGRITKLRRLA